MCGRYREIKERMTVRLLFIGIATNMLNEAVRSYVIHPLCQRTWCVLETGGGGGPRIRIRRVSSRHRLQEFEAEVCTRGMMRWRPWSPLTRSSDINPTSPNKHTYRRHVVISEEIWAEMNTNDAKEYLALREIPQLFEVRDICTTFFDEVVLIKAIIFHINEIYIFFKIYVYEGMFRLLKHVTSLWEHLVAADRCDGAHLGGGTLSS